MAVLAPLLLSPENSAQVTEQQGRSKPRRVDAPDAGWMASSAAVFLLIVVPGCWCSVSPLFSFLVFVPSCCILFSCSLFDCE